MREQTDWRDQLKREDLMPPAPIGQVPPGQSNRGINFFGFFAKKNKTLEIPQAFVRQLYMLKMTLCRESAEPLSMAVKMDLVSQVCRWVGDESIS